MNPRIEVHVTEHSVYDAAQTWRATLTDKMTGMSFTQTAQGGFAYAEIGIVCNESEAYALLANHLGRRVAMFHPMGGRDMIVWEGLVYTVEVDDVSSSSRTLANCFNRVTTIYSTIDSTAPQMLGGQAETAEANDTTSQALYGIRHLRKSIGGTTAAEAVVVRDLNLAAYANPRATPTGAKAGTWQAGGLSVRIGCVGFVETLRQRFYSDTLTTSAAINVIIGEVLTSVGQFISSDQAGLIANTYTRGRYISGARGFLTAGQYIDDLCAVGDGATSRRRWFQVLEGRRAHYIVESGTPDYVIRKKDPHYKCYDAVTGSEVPAFMIRAGRVVKLLDFLPDSVAYANALNDVRTFTIGAVRFIAPNTAVLTPVENMPTDIVLARLGHSRIGNANDIIVTGPGSGAQHYSTLYETGRGIDPLAPFGLEGASEISLYGDQFITEENIRGRDPDRGPVGKFPLPEEGPGVPEAPGVQPGGPDEPAPLPETQPPPGPPGLGGRENVKPIGDGMWYDYNTGNLWIQQGDQWVVKRPYDMPEGFNPASWRYDEGYWVDPSGQYWARGSDDGAGEGWVKSPPPPGGKGTGREPGPNARPPGIQPDWVPVNNGMFYDPATGNIWEPLPGGIWGIKP